MNADFSGFSFPTQWPHLVHALSCLKLLKQAASGLSVPCTFRYMDLTLAADDFGSQFGFFWTPPSLAQVATTCRLLFTSCQVALRRAQVAADFVQHIPGGARMSTPSGQLQTILKHHPTLSQATHSRGRLSRHQSPAKVSPASWGGPCTADPPWWSQPVLAVNWPGGKSLPLTCPQQSRLNYNRKCTQPTQ